MAKAGYCGGDPEKVTQMPVGWVVAAVQYEAFINTYERTYIKMNKGRE